MNWKKTLLGALQIAGSAILLWLVLRQVPFTSVVESIELLIPAYLAAAALMFGLALLSAGLSWYVILRDLSVPVLYRHTLGATFSGLFYSMLIVSSVSFDVGRGVRLYSKNARIKPVAWSVVTDRAAGVIVFVAISIIGLFVYVDDLPLNLNIEKLALFIAIGTLLSIVIITFFPKTITQFTNKIIWSTLAKAIIITLMTHSLTAVSLWFITLAFWPDASILYCLFVTELLNIAELLPISVAGLGIREGIYVVMFEPFGIASDEAVLISLTQFTLTLSFASLGGLYEAYNFVKKNR